MDKHEKKPQLFNNVVCQTLTLFGTLIEQIGSVDTGIIAFKKWHKWELKAVFAVFRLSGFWLKDPN